VSNNAYALAPPLAAGTRPTLQGGSLGIIVVDPPSVRPSRHARAWSAPDLELRLPAGLQAGVDGEAVELSGELHFSQHRASLRVRISSHHPGVSPSGRLAHRFAVP